MQTFTDTQGRAWSAAITVDTIRRVRALIRHDKETIRLSTHDEGGLIDKNFWMATDINKLDGGGKLLQRFHIRQFACIWGIYPIAQH